MQMEKLKAEAYDTLAHIQFLQQKLNDLNNEIAKASQHVEQPQSGNAEQPENLIGQENN